MEEGRIFGGDGRGLRGRGEKSTIEDSGRLRWKMERRGTLRFRPNGETINQVDVS